jgi:hypothetical protein
MNVRSTIAILGLSFLLAGFQNCSQVGFSKSGDGKVMQSLVPVDGGDGSGSGAGTGTTSNDGGSGTVGSGTPSGGDSPGGGTVGSGTTSGGPSGGDSPGGGTVGSGTTSGGGPGGGPGSSGGSSCANDNVSADCEEYVACILDGPGKSVKLGMISSDLQGVHAVAEAVCVTVHECVGPIAKYFHVQGPYERGWCGHNPHVPELTDSQVDALLSNMTPL